MTDPKMADATYIEPLTFEFLKKIIEIEKPDAVLPTLGGQTALNISVELIRASDLPLSISGPITIKGTFIPPW